MNWSFEIYWWFEHFSQPHFYSCLQCPWLFPEAWFHMNRYVLISVLAFPYHHTITLFYHSLFPWAYSVTPVILAIGQGLRFRAWLKQFLKRRYFLLAWRDFRLLLTHTTIFWFTSYLCKWFHIPQLPRAFIMGHLFPFNTSIALPAIQFS